MLNPERFMSSFSTEAIAPAASADTNAKATVDTMAGADPRPLKLRIEQALEAMREGRPVVLLDDDDRENEADLILAAERLTQANMAMMIRECSGIVCLCLPTDKVRSLGLRPMVEHNRSQYGTAFTVSIEAREGVSTGVSAADRITTIRAAIADGAGIDAVVSPGHVFPLVARDGGVLERRGHTEGSVDLARMAGLLPAAVLCELMNPDGTMARRAQALAFAEMYRLPVLTIEDLVAWRRLHG
ncbi:3,4-dihydroxy-2-butanone-4-phosphate synthase (plasmid) [Cupriavidus taiwanensis]|uniref:3,4-dihydroxy-2-butanone 4-phosphate synthase n=2 Tax=Cupriavidus taiwanensis TaxID=164546 RepID=A0A375HG93_9BURK|nr:3,4-dihydroxy-2-butanone-4-phosphate synthase [Cupriavidus taiwanensis]SOZ68357.1 3,4-dihydroxy-2-butanone-4-phosphate synthase [Cupriavidus taiwanensis]SPD57179.1 3,4-dihydroxy-2-butanone-4-phosphate synthase [Cupriavidus taiwanensis]SPK75019.1 3,4-dihydroxy-2-butanone-4-phosphate synthase [Cupriavidus taiwanensis]